MKCLRRQKLRIKKESLDGKSKYMENIMLEITKN